MSLNPKRILLLMDNRGDRNWGSQASTRALVELLRERFPDAEIEGLPRSATLPPRWIGRRSEKWAQGAMARDYGGPFDGLVMGFTTGSWRSKVREADLVVVNGEGTLHPQRQTRRWLPALDYVRRRYRKPLWVVNTTIACAGSSQAWQFERALRGADRVVVRDAISQAALREIGVPAALAADCAYLTRPKPFAPPVDGPYAVLAGTAAMRRWPVEAFRSAVETLRGEGLAVVYTASEWIDLDLPERMGIELPTITEGEASPEELMGLQAGAQILVGGRYHPTIFAALVGTPFVSFTSNTFKTEALMAALGTEELLVQPGDDVVGPIRRVLRHRERWGDQVRSAAMAQVPLARLNVFEVAPPDQRAIPSSRYKVTQSLR